MNKNEITQLIQSEIQKFQALNYNSGRSQTNPHNHDGINSPKISYSDLTDTPLFPTIVFDNAGSNSSTSSGTSVTLSFTTSSVQNRILFVATGSPTTDIVTGATYNGVAMTLIAKNQVPGDRWMYLFCLVNPASGTNNIVVSSSASNDEWVVGAVSYFGAGQSAQPNSFTTITETAQDSTSPALITKADQSWTIIYSFGGSGTAAGPGTTFRTHLGGSTNWFLGDSGYPIHPVGKTSMTVTWPGGTDSASIMAGFSPFN